MYVMAFKPSAHVVAYLTIAFKSKQQEKYDKCNSVCVYLYDLILYTVYCIVCITQTLQPPNGHTIAFTRPVEILQQTLNTVVTPIINEARQVPFRSMGL